jgi:hypothetical protein
MDIGDSAGDGFDGFGATGEKKPRVLPSDLPTSLDDRRHVQTEFVAETEMYDGWQGELRPYHSLHPFRPSFAPLYLLYPTLTNDKGESQFLTTPAPAKPLDFGSLSLNDRDYNDDLTKAPKDSDTRLMEMLAAQAAHQAGPGFEDEQEIANDEGRSDSEKRDLLQKAMNMAASNGDVEKVRKLLSGDAKAYVDLNATDEDGTPPLIYASCFVSYT